MSSGRLAAELERKTAEPTYRREERHLDPSHVLQDKDGLLVALGEDEVGLDSEPLRYWPNRDAVARKIQDVTGF
jgi:hypothetical protein